MSCAMGPSKSHGVNALPRFRETSHQRATHQLLGSDTRSRQPRKPPVSMSAGCVVDEYIDLLRTIAVRPERSLDLRSAREAAPVRGAVCRRLGEILHAGITVTTRSAEPSREALRRFGRRERDRCKRGGKGQPSSAILRWGLVDRRQSRPRRSYLVAPGAAH